MSNLVLTFFFYLFLSGTILFIILGALTIVGNPALLVENTQKDKNNLPILEEGLKGRVIAQYFIAAVIDLGLAILFLILSFRQKEANALVSEIEDMPTISEDNKNNNDKYDNNQGNLMPPESINNNENYGNYGMGEKDNLAINDE